MIALALLAAAAPGAITASGAGLKLVDHGAVPTVIVDPSENSAVQHAAESLRGDLDALAGPAHHIDARRAVIIGTLGDPAIDRLVTQHHLDVAAVRGKWEAYLQQVVDRPAPGIAQALMIIGADRRGAVFGTYDLSRRAGVSPWAWWADVPVPVKASLVVAPGARTDAPAVKYRGIFLNDEDPSLSGWAKAKFGGVNHLFYAHEFDLILRLRGNMIWPAMWGKSIWEDDPASAKIADEIGIVVGTSHHEPMLRAQADWHRYAPNGAWDYTANAAQLNAFWRAGIERSLGRDTLVTVGMRGDGDKPMTEGTAIPLLETIVADQRAIIADVTKKPASDTPQVWALYKEVQDYYDQGMRVPDDVTLLFSDDNWGNLRRLPELGSPERAGGYGIYYHFDYVGGPRNYKWLNVTQVGRVWEEMARARAYGADKLWIANVGDLKPMELPISFFLDDAWKPEAYGPDSGRTYVQAWAAEQFGSAHAAAIADILDRETRYTARRTPELTAAETWDASTEWPRIVADYDRLEADATRVGQTLPASMQDSFYELVLHPVQATANLHRMYAAVALDRAHAAAGLADTAALAQRAAALFAKDGVIHARYEAVAGGKWLHMMDQTHIGYTGWQQPPADLLPALTGPTARHPLPASWIAIDAVEARATPAGEARWTRVEGLGRTGASMAVLPQIASFAPGRGPSLSFTVTTGTGPRWLSLVAAPSLPVTKSAHLRAALRVDNGPAQLVDLAADPSDKAWAQGVIAHARVASARVDLSAGRHSITLTAIDPGVVAERLTVTPAPLDPLALDLPARKNE